MSSISGPEAELHLPELRSRVLLRIATRTVIAGPDLAPIVPPPLLAHVHVPWVGSEVQIGKTTRRTTAVTVVGVAAAVAAGLRLIALAPVHVLGLVRMVIRDPGRVHDHVRIADTAELIAIRMEKVVEEVVMKVAINSMITDLHKIKWLLVVTRQLCEWWTYVCHPNDLRFDERSLYPTW